MSSTTDTAWLAGSPLTTRADIYPCETNFHGTLCCQGPVCMFCECVCCSPVRPDERCCAWPAVWSHLTAGTSAGWWELCRERHAHVNEIIWSGDHPKQAGTTTCWKKINTSIALIWLFFSLQSYFMVCYYHHQEKRVGVIQGIKLIIGLIRGICILMRQCDGAITSWNVILLCVDQAENKATRTACASFRDSLSNLNDAIHFQNNQPNDFRRKLVLQKQWLFTQVLGDAQQIKLFSDLKYAYVVSWNFFWKIKL